MTVCIMQHVRVNTFCGTFDITAKIHMHALIIPAYYYMCVMQPSAIEEEKNQEDIQEHIRPGAMKGNC